MTQPAEPRNVGILIFADVEILDFCGPFEVFASASLPAETDGGQETRLFEVFTVTERPKIVACRGGLLVQPNHTLDTHPPLDIDMALQVIRRLHGDEVASCTTRDMEYEGDGWRVMGDGLWVIGDRVMGC